MPHTSSDAAIDCRALTKRFGEVVALDSIDLRVDAGEVVGYLGPNGAGKSTTIRILLDLARPDAGSVAVLGRDPRSGSINRSRIGYLPGELRLDDRLRVDETLRSWATLRGGVDERYVQRLCDRLALDVTRRNRDLSSGNRRKVGLVGALMARPDLLVLDEPTAGVDPLVQAEFVELVAEVREEGRTVFLSSHMLSEVEQVADRVVVIRDGRIVGDGAVAQLRRQTGQPFEVEFARAAPVDELRRLAGVRRLEVVGTVVRGVLDGDPNEFLAIVAIHPVEHIELAPPDLEQTFLDFYAEDPPS